MTVTDFRQLALFFPETIELPHFELASFRVNNKIFATLNESEKLACLMLTPVDQSVFVNLLPEVIYPVPNSWGKGGATYIKLSEVSQEVTADALKCAYRSKVPKHLASLFNDELED